MVAEYRTSPAISVLGDDPPRTHRINANSFQQHALVTANGWQYAAFYKSKADGGEGGSICYPVLARRELPQGGAAASEHDGAWEYIVFDDYEQRADDGHNTISIGICAGDGTIHLSFDHHCDPLRYRHSVEGLTTNPRASDWTPALFTKTANTLPGIAAPTDAMQEVSYPRFVGVGDDMMLTYRIGQAGNGSDVLYHYSAADHAYTYLGVLLTGEGNSPYINGLDADRGGGSGGGGALHVSWTYRKFVDYAGAGDPASAAHKQQAGPNGPENNYDLCYLRSDDGRVWSDSDGRRVAALAIATDGVVPETVRPGAEGTTVFRIPTGSGILNQEAQCVAPDGEFHVLNRERHDGVETWMLYSRHPSDLWKRNPIKGFSPTETGSRGSICADRQSNLYFALPGNTDSSLAIVRASKAEGYLNFETVWKGDGYDGEPLVDQARLDESDLLSVFTRTDKDAEGRRKVVVMDFDLSGL